MASVAGHLQVTRVLNEPCAADTGLLLKGANRSEFLSAGRSSSNSDSIPVRRKPCNREPYRFSLIIGLDTIYLEDLALAALGNIEVFLLLFFGGPGCEVVTAADAFDSESFLEVGCGSFHDVS